MNALFPKTIFVVIVGERETPLVAATRKAAMVVAEKERRKIFAHEIEDRGVIPPVMLWEWGIGPNGYLLGNASGDFAEDVLPFFAYEAVLEGSEELPSA